MFSTICLVRAIKGIERKKYIVSDIGAVMLSNSCYFDLHKLSFIELKTDWLRQLTHQLCAASTSKTRTCAANFRLR